MARRNKEGNFLSNLLIITLTTTIFILSFVIFNRIDQSIRGGHEDYTNSALNEGNYSDEYDESSSINNVITPTSAVNNDSMVTIKEIGPGLIKNKDSETKIMPTISYQLKYPTSEKIGNEGLMPSTPIIIVNNITPEGQINYDQCTVAFSVPGVDGFPWAITAGHCGEEGEKVFSKPANDDFSKMQFLGTIRAVPQVSYETGMGDWAAIRLDPNAIRPESPQDIPMNLLIDDLDEGEILCKNGSRTGFDCGPQGRKGVKTVFGNSDAKLDEVTLCALSGDSGSPIYNNRGIVGVLSSSTASPEDMKNGKCSTESGAYYTPTQDIVNQLKNVVPNAQFIDK